MEAIAFNNRPFNALQFPTFLVNLLMHADINPGDSIPCCFLSIDKAPPEPQGDNFRLKKYSQ